MAMGVENMETIVSLLSIAGIVWAWIKFFEEEARILSYRADLDGGDMASAVEGVISMGSWVSAVGREEAGSSTEGGGAVCSGGAIDDSCWGSGELVTDCGGGLEGGCFDWIGFF